MNNLQNSFIDLINRFRVSIYIKCHLQIIPVADESNEDPFKKMRPPPRLAKLEKRKKKKKFTEEEIQAKLEKAKLRREVNLLFIYLIIIFIIS